VVGRWGGLGRGSGGVKGWNGWGGSDGVSRKKGFEKNVKRKRCKKGRRCGVSGARWC